MPEFINGFFLQQRQNKVEKPVNFSGGTVFFSILFFFWLLFAGLLCLQGYGLDTDAWLMAQTAGRLRAGESYDPARSLGNPVWEFLLVFLQPDYEFIISNGLNLILALLFLWRLNRLLPGIPMPGIWFLRTGICLLPVFTEAAGSSMELMSAWYLFLESLLAVRQNRQGLTFFLVLLLTFTRPEFFIFISAAAIKLRNRKLYYLIPVLTALTAWVFWTLGKNPAPFGNLSEFFRFYAGRIWFLIRQAGLLLPVYLFLLYKGFHQTHQLLKWPGRLSTFFFILCPFEWAYAFPAMLSGMMNLPAKAKNKRLLQALIAISTGSSLFFPLSGLPALYFQRQKMLHHFRQAEAYRPETPVLLLDGATYLPTKSSLWERSHENRLFRKKNSLFWVAERLQQSELDSFRTAGFRICRLGTGPGDSWLQELP